jgi:3'-phosphoadenosine 5'-phosphosulfate (PAPS) 3'-phosphatase
MILGDNFVIEERGTVEVKGKCRMKTYWLLGRPLDGAAGFAATREGQQKT